MKQVKFKIGSFIYDVLHETEEYYIIRFLGKVEKFLMDEIMPLAPQVTDLSEEI